MGVRQGAPVPVSPLRLQGEAEDAHRAAHGADAQGEDLQAGARIRRAETGRRYARRRRHFRARSRLRARARAV